MMKGVSAWASANPWLFTWNVLGVAWTVYAVVDAATKTEKQKKNEMGEAQKSIENVVNAATKLAEPDVKVVLNPLTITTKK
jgi:threonine/homoserine/homoserine lactone efflux protein